MKARMEKYDIGDTGEIKQRTRKNENLYSEVQNMNIDYVDIDVDNAVELSPSSSLKKSREDYQKQRELNKILPSNRAKEYEPNDIVEPKEDRVYDINEILKMARENKLFDEPDKKRLINTEYNILTKLDVNELDSEEIKKEDLRTLIDDIYEKTEPKKEKEVGKYPKGEEKLLSDLFEESKQEKEEETNDENIEKEEMDNKEEKEVKQEEPEIKEEKQEKEKETESNQVEEKQATKLENSMYDFGLDKKSKKKDKKNKKASEKTKSYIDDTQGYSPIEDEEGMGLTIAIIIVVLLILLTCGFFLYQYFFGA